MSNRRTSTYSLRFAAGSVDAIPTLRKHIEGRGFKIVDEGVTTLAWRAESDAAAIDTATAAIATADADRPEPIQAVLSTGLGVHRRTVAETEGVTR